MNTNILVQKNNWNLCMCLGNSKWLLTFRKQALKYDIQDFGQHFLFVLTLTEGLVKVILNL